MKFILTKNPDRNSFASVSGNYFCMTPHLKDGTYYGGNFTTMRPWNYYSMMYAAINGKKMPEGWDGEEPE